MSPLHANLSLSSTRQIIVPKETHSLHYLSCASVVGGMKCMMKQVRRRWGGPPTYTSHVAKRLTSQLDTPASVGHSRVCWTHPRQVDTSASSLLVSLPACRH